MARYVIEQRLCRPEQLTAFNVAGYRYAVEQSSELSPVFLRQQAE